jgi:hypothetical protein
LILFQQFINNHLIPFNKSFVFIQNFQRAKHPSLSFHNPVRKQLMFSEANLGFHQLSHHLSMPHSVTEFFRWVFDAWRLSLLVCLWYPSGNAFIQELSTLLYQLSSLGFLFKNLSTKVNLYSVKIKSKIRWQFIIKIRWCYINWKRFWR